MAVLDDYMEHGGGGLWEGWQPVTHWKPAVRRGPLGPHQAGCWLKECHPLTPKGSWHSHSLWGVLGPAGAALSPHHAYGTPTTLDPGCLPWWRLWAVTLLGPASATSSPQSPGTRDCPLCLKKPVPVSPRSRVDSKTLTRNTRIIAEALTRVIYNLTEKVSYLVLVLSVCTQPCRPTSHPAPPSTGDAPRHAGVHRADGKVWASGGTRGPLLRPWCDPACNAPSRSSRSS